MFTLDPKGAWEVEWVKENPEPHPDPTFVRGNGVLEWRTSETMDRIDWHARRWRAFKFHHPNWRAMIWGSKNGLGQEEPTK